MSAQMGKSLSPPFYTLNILFYGLFSHVFVDINSLETLFLTFVVDKVVESEKRCTASLCPYRDDASSGLDFPKLEPGSAKMPNQTLTRGAAKNDPLTLIFRWD